MAQWAFIAQSRGGSAYADLAPYLSDRQVSMLLNRPGQVTGSLNLSSPGADLSWLTAGVHELKVLRDNAQVGGLFRLTDVDVSLGRQTAELKLTWEGIETYLRDLLIPAATSQVGNGQSLHAWNLINTVQALAGASVYNFSRGLVPATDPTKDRTYTDPVDCLTAIESLAERNDGFDFAFNAARQLDCYYPQRGTASGLVLEWGANVFEMGYSIAAGPGAVASDILVKDGGGHSATATDATARTLYGRRDQMVVLSDLNEAVAAVLQSYADAMLQVMKQPLFVPTVVIDPTEVAWGAYGLGDTVTVRAKAGGGAYVNVNQSQRIVGITVTLAATDTESVSLELNDPLPMIVDRALLKRVKDLQSPSATNGVVAPTLEERIQNIERFIS